MRRWWCRMLASLLPVTLARAQDAGEPAGERLARAVVPEVVRISETVKPGRNGEQGFGLVVGERAGRLYVVTADHVVRDDDGEPHGSVQLTFSTEQGEPRDATLLQLRLPRQHGDLAVLEVAKPPGVALSWPAATDVEALTLGTRAWRIGKQGRWTPSVNPGAYVGMAEGIWLAFDDLDTPLGSSGGPVVTAAGVVGLVIADGGSTGDPDRVLPINLVARQFQAWDLPWNLERPSPAPAPQAVPPPTPVTSQVGQPSLAGDVQGFLAHYYASLSDPADVVLARLPAEVSDPIAFFGKQTSRAAYLSEQARYLHRWPERHFKLQTDQIAIRCDPTAMSCGVTGVIDYDVRDPASGRVSTGTEAIFVRLHREGDQFVIDEQGSARR